MSVIFTVLQKFAGFDCKQMDMILYFKGKKPIGTIIASSRDPKSSIVFRIFFLAWMMFPQKQMRGEIRQGSYITFYLMQENAMNY